MLRSLLPSGILKASVDRVTLNKITEIRLRVGRQLCVKDASNKYLLNVTVTEEDVKHVIRVATKNSLYAYQDEIKCGFISYNGIRIGLVGTVVTDGNKIITIKDYSSLVIRVPHEIIGIANRFNNVLNSLQNTLIIAPPYGGKTTLIRDIARVLSGKYDVLIIDERQEIYNDTFTFGSNVDVISGAPKELVTEGIIRAISAEVVILDELIPSSDNSVIERLIGAGIKVYATLHGNGTDFTNESYNRLIDLFDVAIILGNKPTVGSIKSVVRLK